MQTLFNDSETFQKERPTEPTEKQLEEFYLKMANEIKKEGFSDSSENAIVKDLQNLYPFNNNGFEMAKELESYSAHAVYEIDTTFCEWLDSLCSEYNSIKTENAKAWVKAHNPQPKFEKGTKLLINKNICYKKDVGQTVFVTGINTEQAYYLIDEKENRQGGTVLAYERVEGCCSVA